MTAAPSPAATGRALLRGPEATDAAGAALAATIGPGDALLLFGPLGAGKTALARAMIRAALGDPFAEAPSPTFTLVQTYETRRGQWLHADLYRLSDADEAHELGLALTDADPSAAQPALLIEWPERLGAHQPPRRLEIHLDLAEAGGARSLRWRAVGPGWDAALQALAGLPAAPPESAG